MSNHSGSYMLNRVLEMLEEKGILADLGKEKAQLLLVDTVGSRRTTTATAERFWTVSGNG